MTNNIVACILILSGFFCVNDICAQGAVNSKTRNFIKNDDPFGSRSFIENKGQIKPFEGQPVDYMLDNGTERIYFTTKGLIYELTKIYPITKEHHEALEKGKTNALRPIKVAFVHMHWRGSNDSIQLEASEKQSYYVTYGAKELNSYAYKKLLYKNVYKNIDIEYTIPEDKTSGIKYTVILRPGGNPEDIQILYSGDVNQLKIVENEVKIKTPLDDIIEHTPLSFEEDGTLVESKFVLKDGVISFQLLKEYNKNGTLFIDPWVSSTSSLTSNTFAYDVDYDYIGNTYVYGGGVPYKSARYNAAGVLSWVFSGTILTPTWTSAPYNYPSNFGVDRFTGKTYIGQGFNASGNLIVRLDANGNYDNFMNSPNNQFQEVWDMGFHCTTAEMFVLGGGTTSNISAVTMNSVTATISLTTFQPLITGAAQDVVSHAIDDAGNIFVIYAGNSAVSNKISLVNSAFNNNVWTQPSGFNTFGEIANKNAYAGGGGISSNGFNALAANANYLYYYDGSKLAAYNKITGLMTASTIVTGVSIKQQGGIAVDDCNNLYLGGNGSILSYSFNGTVFSQLSSISLSLSTSSQYVFDLKLDKQTKTLYACGSNFVGVYSPVHTLACQTLSSACLFSQGGISVATTSITCANLGTATCTAIGGVGPHTYTWLPSLQSGSVATGLSPGLHSIIVHDIGNGSTYTASTFLSPLVALTGTVQNPIYVPCFGGTSASASVMGLSGGSSTQNYLWTNGSNSQTTSVASGLGLGVYSVSVIDALTACTLSQTFAVMQPPALTLNIVANSPSTCANSSVTLLSQIGGGTPGYTYSWSAGPTTGTYLTTQSLPGPHVFTLTVFDSNNCPVTSTISILYIATPTLNLNSPTICSGHQATLTVSGANSYTWSNSSNAISITTSPTVSTQYSVVGSGSLCTASISAWVSVLSLPNPTIVSNSPVCQGQVLNLNANGGVSYVWSGPNNFTSTIQSPALNFVPLINSGTYSIIVTGANSCTIATTHSVLIRPLPIVSALGSTVCETQTLTLLANTSSLNIINWLGPNNYNSVLQNPTINSPSVNQSGTYTVFVTDINACSNSAIAHVTVTALPNPSFTVNSPLCDEQILHLNGSLSLGAISFSWSGPNGFSSSHVNPQIPSVSLLSAGNYTLETIAGPCTASLTKPVIIYPLPNINVNGIQSICETKSLSLSISSATNVFLYNWYGPNAFHQQTHTLTRFLADSTFSGTYTALVIDANSCQNTQTISVMVHSNPILVAPNVIVCLNDPAKLVVMGADNYKWSGPNFFQANGSSVIINQASSIFPLTYTVIGSYTNSCQSHTTLILSTLELPKPSLTVYPNLIRCLNDEVVFEGFGANNYLWSGPNEISFSGKSFKFKTSTLFASGNYTLTAIDSNYCRASIDTLLIVNNLPSGGLKKMNPENCVPFCSDFQFSSNYSGPIKSYWNIEQKQFEGIKFPYCFKTSGTTTIKGFLKDTLTTCTNTIQLIVDVYPKPKADFSFLPQPVVVNNEINFSNESTGLELTKFNWYLTSNEGYSSNSKNFMYRFSQLGNFPVALIVENKWACSDTIVKAIHVLEDFLLFVPNAFTPNGDNLNDVFKPVISGDKLYHLQVFDRWGALIFETTDNQVAWDGTYKNQVCKSDIYTWKIIVSSLAGEQKEMKGHVTLYR